VKITVTAEGNIEDPTLTLSTAYPRLDRACLAGIRSHVARRTRWLEQ
jgi:outer membrane biosynthesis protein TonB